MTHASFSSRPRLVSLRATPTITALCLAIFLTRGAYTEEPPAFALTNARLHLVSTTPIEKGSIVFRNGIIEAVGAGISIPKDARVIDASGMTVYPGLIDSLSDVALEELRPAIQPTAPEGGRPAVFRSAIQQQTPTGTSDERLGLTPYLMAADILNFSNRRIEAARAAGITTALVAPRGRFFQGQSALINLSGTSAGEMVVKTPIALHFSLQGASGFGGGSSGSYPGSLMGILAFIKQTLLDAQQYEAAWKIYEGNPGTVRPAYNRAHQALLPVLHRKVPVVLPGDAPHEIERLLALAELFKLDLILGGGAWSGKMAPLLKEKKIPVLLTAKFPERDREGDPELEEEIEVLRRRVEAPMTAVTLARTGVLFAFQSGDMGNPRDFLRNVTRTIEAGLDKDLALRALTLTPAEIFGVADRLGSLERGKTANLVVATGDIFETRTRVKYVFVDGRKFDIQEPEPPQRPERPMTAGRIDLTGTWNLKVNAPSGPVDVTLDLKQNGNILSGTVTSPLGTADVADGTLTGDSMSFKVTVTPPGSNSMVVTFTGTVQGNRLTGTVDAGHAGKMDFSGSRRPGKSEEDIQSMGLYLQEVQS